MCDTQILPRKHILVKFSSATIFFLDSLCAAFLCFMMAWHIFTTHVVVYPSFYCKLTWVPFTSNFFLLLSSSVTLSVRENFIDITDTHEHRIHPGDIEIGFNCINYFNEYGMCYWTEDSRESIDCLLHDKLNYTRVEDNGFVHVSIVLFSKG